MRRFATLVLAIALAASCGKSDEQRQTEQVQKAADQLQKGADQMQKGAGSTEKGADQMQKGAEDMAKGLADMARGLTAMAGGDPNQKAVDPVSFKDLQTVLPEVNGWQKGKPTGERMTSPVNYAEAAITYRKGDAEIEEKIVDSAFNQLLVAPFSIFLTVGYEKETEDGYEKALKVRDYPGWEKWNSKTNEGELNAIINKRFIVEIQGRRIDSPKALYAVMDGTDLKRLAEMK